MLNRYTEYTCTMSDTDIHIHVCQCTCVSVQCKYMSSFQPLTCVYILMSSSLQCDVHGSLKSNGRGNSNVMPLDEEKGEIRSDSGTQNGIEREEESEYASVTIAALKNQPQPSLDQAVQYQGIDIKKTKVSWSHDTHMIYHTHS